MAQRSLIVSELKRSLREQGLTYAVVAMKLELSVASVKRLFSVGDLSLERVDQICELLQLEITDLLARARERPATKQLTLAQEQEIVADPKLFFIAWLVLNRTVLSPEWLARQLIRRMGDDVDLTEAFAEGTPSIEALNQLMGRPQAPPGAPGQGQGQEEDPGPTGAGRGPPRPPGPGQDPTAQGPVGMANAMTGPGTQGPLGPHVPPLQIYGANGNRPGTGGPARVPGRSQGMPTP